MRLFRIYQTLHNKISAMWVETSSVDPGAVSKRIPKFATEHAQLNFVVLVRQIKFNVCSFYEIILL